MALRLLAFLPILLLPGLAQRPLLVDGDFADWAGLSPQAFDLAWDADPTVPLPDSGGAPPAASLTVAHSAEYLFFRLESPAVLDLTESNSLLLLLDTDDNPATGSARYGLGADLVWRFGTRNGSFYPPGATAATQVFHDDLGLVTAPTVTGHRFEIALRRSALPDGANPLFPQSAVRLAFVDENGAPEVLPSAPARLLYDFSAPPVPSPDRITLTRHPLAHLRVLTWNVLFEGFADSAHHPAYGRVLRSLQPDLIAFQEINDFGHLQVRDFAAQYLDPLPGHATLYSTSNSDLRLVSRYPLGEKWQLAIPGQGAGNHAVIVDTTAAFGYPLLLIHVHLPSSSDDLGRQKEADQIMAFIRDARTPGGELDLQPDSPILILGDTNLVGLREQLATLLAGAIQDTLSFGPAFAPDADGSAFAPAPARLTHLPFVYTWRNDSSSFNPGRLDYQIVSDSVWKARKAFVLDTRDLTPNQLLANGLEAGDTAFSDHLPVVADYQAWPAGELRRRLLADSPVLPDSWSYSWWLGLFHPAPAPAAWLFHPALGWIHPDPYADTSGGWFFLPGLDWLWTGPELFPLAWSHSAQSWVFLDLPASTPAARHLYIYASAQWFTL